MFVSIADAMTLPSTSCKLDSKSGAEDDAAPGAEDDAAPAGAEARALFSFLSFLRRWMLPGCLQNGLFHWGCLLYFPFFEGWWKHCWFDQARMMALPIS